MDNSSIADIFLEIWKCMSPEKRFNTLYELNEKAGIEDQDFAYQVRHAMYLVDEIVNPPANRMVQA